MSGLALLPPVHDLPILWDGRAVTWGPWSTTSTSMRFHEVSACEKCGTIGEPNIAIGKRDPEAGATIPGTVKRRTRTGRPYEIATIVPAVPLRDLYALRCPDCAHDRVHDQATDETWDLDASDYGDAGSTADGALW